MISSKNRFNLGKAFIWVITAGITLSIIFMLTSMRIGPVKKMRGIVLLEYTGILKDPRSNAELIAALKSHDEVVQFNAITAMAYREYSPENVQAILEYLKSDRGTQRVNNIAVWALGELRAQEAKEYLISLKGNEDFEQYEVKKAIRKIEGEIPKPFWRK